MDERFKQVWAPVFTDGLNTEKTGILLKASNTNNIPLQQRIAEFEAWFNSPGGFKRIAFAMQTPLKNRLDYVAVGRKLLLVDELPQGEIPAYDLDIPEFGAVKVAARGTPPIFEANIKRVYFPTFMIAANEPVSYEENAIRRYPAFQRGKERVAIAMAIGEDTEIFKILDAATSVAGISHPVVDSGGTFTKSTFAQLWSLIAESQLNPTTIVMNPTIYGDVLTWNSQDLDQVSLNLLIEGASLGVMFGCRFILTPKLPISVNQQGNRVYSIYCVTSPDKLGRLPERQAVQVKVWDNVPQTRWDILGIEFVGMGVHNVKGVAKATVTK